MSSKPNSQCIPTEHTHSIPTYGQATYNEDDMIINIQILYDPNAPMEPELWNGSFYLISLHRSIKHIVSDSKNIKDLLNFMAKYIVNKQIDSSKANNLEDFHGIGEAVWNFIFSVYKANWNVLYTDNNSISLKRKIAAKFILKTQPMTAKNIKVINKPFLASKEKILPPILAKSQKEVNLISKFFKGNKLANINTQPPKSYSQASKQNISMSEVIEIKEIFPPISTKKIDQINNIIKGTPKTKPHIQMTTKEPLRKHIIIPMNNDNNTKFMKNSSVHVANINRALRNVKSEVLADFICSDPLGITVVTNKVSM